MENIVSTNLQLVKRGYDLVYAREKMFLEGRFYRRLSMLGLGSFSTIALWKLAKDRAKAKYIEQSSLVLLSIQVALAGLLFHRFRTSIQDLEAAKSAFSSLRSKQDDIRESKLTYYQGELRSALSSTDWARLDDEQVISTFNTICSGLSLAWGEEASLSLSKSEFGLKLTFSSAVFSDALLSSLVTESLRKLNRVQFIACYESGHFTGASLESWVKEFELYAISCQKCPVLDESYLPVMVAQGAHVKYLELKGCSLSERIRKKLDSKLVLKSDGEQEFADKSELLRKAIDMSITNIDNETDEDEKVTLLHNLFVDLDKDFKSYLYMTHSFQLQDKAFLPPKVMKTLFVYLGYYCPLLQTLFLNKLDKLENDAFEYLVDSSLRIKSLKVASCGKLNADIADQISKLDQLEELIIEDCRKIDETTFKKKLSQALKEHSRSVSLTFNSKTYFLP